VPRRLDSRLAPCPSCVRVSERSTKKQPRSWAVTLIKNRGVFLGFVEAPDEKAGELVAAKAFTLDEWQRKRLLVREHAL
jgi:hypothetical protein